jgi:hypothetical protein
MSRVTEFGAGIGVGEPAPQVLPVKTFAPYFKPEGEKKLSTEIQDLPGLQTHRAVRHMAERVAETAATAERRGQVGEALQWYPNERERNASIGISFNAARAKKGLSLYHPEHPELAGLLLASGYSQNSSEKRREQLIQKTMATGEIQNHLSTRILQHAIDNNIHPADVYDSPKLRDFAGSISEPETWTGGGRGLGYTIDRHQHDAAMGQKFGDDSRAISSGDSAVRRYRTLQAAHNLAHQWFDPAQKLSRPQFQALSWVGWRGAS